MKKDLHPVMNKDVEVICICGNKFTIESTKKGPIKVESCPACHETYTGTKETKVVKGRMEQYLERQKRIQKIQKDKASKSK